VRRPKKLARSILGVTATFRNTTTNRTLNLRKAQSCLRVFLPFFCPVAWIMLTFVAGEEVQTQSYEILPANIVGDGSVKLFNKWSFEDVEVKDISLT
jgi:hypothetical protein